MPVKKKRRKKSGVVYFATNNRINNMVKIGQTVDSTIKRLEAANTSLFFTFFHLFLKVCPRLTKLKSVANTRE